MGTMTQEERFEKLCDQVVKLADEVAALAKLVRELEVHANFQRGFNTGQGFRLEDMEKRIKVLEDWKNTHEKDWLG